MSAPGVGVPAIVAAALASAPDAHLPALKAYVRAGCEDRPGVYRFLGHDGEILYVGKSKQLRTRLLSYFRCVYPDDKGARILRDAVHIEWEYVPSEFGALLLELRQIKRWRPRYNVQMKRDARHWAFVKLTKGTAPKLQVIKGTTGSTDGGVWYGPFTGARHLGDAVRELNDALGLRDCANDVPLRFADQRELFDERALPILATSRTPRCLRFEVKKCLGPCVAGCTMDEYRARVLLARGFLDGADDAPIVMLRTEMERSAERLEFERAALLRDKVRRLEVLQEQFARIRFGVEELSFAYVAAAQSGQAADARIYLVRRGRVRAEAPVPTDPESEATLLAQARAIYEPRDRGGSSVPTHEVDELLLLSSWFRLRSAELGRTLKPAAVLALARGAHETAEAPAREDNGRWQGAFAALAALPAVPWVRGSRATRAEDGDDGVDFGGEATAAEAIAAEAIAAEAGEPLSDAA